MRFWGFQFSLFASGMIFVCVCVFFVGVCVLGENLKKESVPGGVINTLMSFVVFLDGRRGLHVLAETHAHAHSYRK